MSEMSLLATGAGLSASQQMSFASDDSMQPAVLAAQSPARTNQSAASLTASVGREEFADWRDNYLPEEEGFIDQFANIRNYVDGINQTEDFAERSAKTTKEIAGRQRSRLGLQMTQEQQNAIARLDKLRTQVNVSGAYNKATDQANDMQMEALSASVNYGRGMASSASQLAQQYGQISGDRQAANKRIRKQNQQQAASTTAMIAMMFASSSRDYKHSIRPASKERASLLLDKLVVKEFTYNNDMGALAGEKMIGLVTEETPDEFVSNDGKQVNLYSLVGALIADNQLMKERLKVLENG